MKKLIILFLIITNISFALSISGNKIVGERGESIPLKRYNRIVVYNLGAVEILYKIGAGKNIVGIAEHKVDVYPKAEIKKVSSAGSITNPSVEKIASLKPDLVITNVMSNKKKELDKLGIPNITFASKSLKDIENNTIILGKITGKEKESLNLVNWMKGRVEYAKKNYRLRGKGIVVYSVNPLTSFAKNSLPVEVLQVMGLNIVVPNNSKKPIISTEYLLKENPDYIIGTRGIKNKQELNKIQLVNQTKAYKNNRLICIDSSKILRGSYRVFEEFEIIYNQMKK